MHNVGSNDQVIGVLFEALNCSIILSIQCLEGEEMLPFLQGGLAGFEEAVGNLGVRVLGARSLAVRAASLEYLERGSPSSGADLRILMPDFCDASAFAYSTTYRLFLTPTSDRYILNSSSSLRMWNSGLVLPVSRRTSSGPIRAIDSPSTLIFEVNYCSCSLVFGLCSVSAFPEAGWANCSRAFHQ